MTNFEKWKEEILKISKEGELIAVRNNIPVGCNSISCGECDFTQIDGSCILRRMEWLYREYQGPITLTRQEHNFCEFLKTGYLSRTITTGSLVSSNQKPELVTESSELQLWLRSGYRHYFNIDDQDNYSIKFEFIKEGESYEVQYLKTLPVKD